MIRIKIYLLNKLFTTTFEKHTFYEIWKKTKFELNHFRILNNIDYKIISRAHFKIKNDKVEKCILLNY